ncbi:Oligoribonuclease, mitochondrial [Savitreella phatthalungensis]
MTGLDINKDQIIELACLATDFDLHPLWDSPFHRVIHAEDHLLDGMDDWCTSTHGRSGLTEECRASKTSLRSCELELLDHLHSHGLKQGQCHLAGNSIHADRLFLTHQLPDFTKFLHYRQVDVSSIKLLVNHWAPNHAHAATPDKKAIHRAVDDLQESIAELQMYRHFFT